MKSFIKTFLPRIFYFLFFASIFSSCFAPVNLNYESARLLEKGETEIQAQGSYYKLANPFLNGEEILGEELDYSQRNCGIKLGLGVSDKYNVKAKVEGLFLYNKDVSINSTLFVEIDNKFKLAKWASFSFPVGMYFMSGLDLTEKRLAFWQFDPRFYLTYSKSNQFEFSVIPKCHIINLVSFNPAISVGAGFSDDLSKWSIRPELGFDFSSFSAGISFSTVLGTKN